MDVLDEITFERGSLSIIPHSISKNKSRSIPNDWSIHKSTEDVNIE